MTPPPDSTAAPSPSGAAMPSSPETQAQAAAPEVTPRVQPPVKDGEKWHVTIEVPWPAKTRRLVVTGTFSNWSPVEGVAMTQITSSDAGPSRDLPIARATLELAPGVWLYKFVADGEKWFADPHNPWWMPDGVGGRNSVVFVGLAGKELESAMEQMRAAQARPQQIRPRTAGMAPLEGFITRVGLADPERRNLKRGRMPGDLEKLLSPGPDSPAFQKRIADYYNKLKAEGRIPLVDGNRISFFLWKDDATPEVTLACEFNDWHSRSELLTRIPGTPLHVLTLELDHAPPRFTYCFVEWPAHDRPRPLLDSGNPSVAYDGFPRVSCWNPPASPRGTLLRQDDAMTTAPVAGLPALGARMVEVWTPPGYYLPENANRRYPVLYMHDGQNIWDQLYTGPFGNPGWAVDDWIEKLAAAGEIEAPIVVGIGNTQRRLLDYGGGPDLFDATKHPYLQWIERRLKPEIDAQYRTRPEPASTVIMGSSMGGYISLLAGLHRPGVYGGAGLLSPAFQLPDAKGQFLEPLVDKLGHQPVRIYLDHGDAGMARDGAERSKAMVERLRAAGWKDGVDLQYLAVHGAEHTELAWRARLDQPLRFFFGLKKAPDDTQPSVATSPAASAPPTPIPSK